MAGDTNTLHWQRMAVEAISSSRATIPQFLEAARILRHVATGTGLRHHTGMPNPLARVERRRVDERVATVVTRLQAAGARAGEFSELRLAEAVGLGAGYLGRLVHQQTGWRLRDWSSGIRLQLAVAAIASGTGSVKQAAIESGFAGPESFNRSFRRIFGMSPTAFARLHASVAADSQNR